MASAAKRTKTARSGVGPPSGAAPGKGIGVAPESFATASESAPSAATLRRRSSPSSSSRLTFTSSSASANGLRPTLPLGAERTVLPAASRRVRPLKPRPTPQEIVHDIGRAEGEGVTVADPLPQRGFDLVVQPYQSDWPARQHRRQDQPADDEQGCGEFDRPEAYVRDPSRGDPPPARPKTWARGARRHVAHGGPGARPRRHAKPSDQ